ncbi:MAG TPA: WbuC family cupin fold metalloprotein [Gemmataceae bacterium]|nr:WbuC family cupin fold metalloprotein [Gemmataceae bacterium]
MRAQPLNPEVLVAIGPVVTVSRPDLEKLKERATENPRQRVRLCAHQSADDRLHEMLIVLGRGTYVRPHKHPNKTESFHIVEGQADLILFDDDGIIGSVLAMGEYDSGRTFFYRLCAPYYHTVIVRSDALVLHETTNGPFVRADTIFAPWAPDEADADSRSRYVAALEQCVARFVSGDEGTDRRVKGLRST